MTNIQNRVRKFSARLQKNRTYCKNRDAKSKVKGHSHNWTTSGRTKWIKTCASRKGGCNQVCRYKYTVYRTKDQYNDARQDELKLAREVKSEWNDLNKLKKDSSTYKQGRAKLETLRKKAKAATNKRVKMMSKYKSARAALKKARKTGCPKSKSVAKKSYYKWSWSWWLKSGYCKTYTNAVAKVKSAKSALNKAKQAHKAAVNKVTKAVNSKAAATSIKSLKATRDKAYKLVKTKKTALQTAQAKRQQAIKTCYGSYKSSSWYTKWRSYRYGSKSSSRTSTRTVSKYKRFNWKQSKWDRRWTASWSTGGWGWRKNEWRVYRKTCKASGMCEKSCAAKYKIETINKKHTDLKKIYDFLKKQVAENAGKTKDLKGADLTKATADNNYLKKQENKALKKKTKLYKQLKQSKKDYAKIKGKCPKATEVKQALEVKKNATKHITDLEKEKDKLKEEKAKATNASVAANISGTIKTINT